MLMELHFPMGNCPRQFFLTSSIQNKILRCIHFPPWGTDEETNTWQILAMLLNAPLESAWKLQGRHGRRTNMEWNRPHSLQNKTCLYTLAKHPCELPSYLGSVKEEGFAQE